MKPKNYKLRVVMVGLLIIAVAVFVGAYLPRLPETLKGLKMVKTEIGTLQENNSSASISRSGNEFLVYGMTDISPFARNKGATDTYIYKISAAGTRLWGYQFGTSGSDKFMGAESCPNGDVIVTGITTGGLFGVKPKQTAPFVARISSSGKLIWARPVTGAGITAVDIYDVSDTRILLEVGSYDDPSVHTRLQVLDMSGKPLVDERMPDDSYPEFIGRIGSRYHYRIDEKAVTFGPDLKHLNAFKMDWSHTPQSNIVRLNGAEHFISTVGMSSIALTSLADGKVKAELPISTPELSYDHENTLIYAGNNGAKIWFVIMTQATSDGMTTDAIMRDEAKCSAALYETDGIKTVKLFDIYGPPASDETLKQVVTRPDGSYACIYEIWRRHHSYIVLDIYAPNGSRLGHNVLPATVEWKSLNPEAGIVMGTQELVQNNMRTQVVASLPKVASPVLTLSSGKPTDGPEFNVTCDTRGAVIRYTTDGSEPTLRSPKYSRPISVDSDTNVKARAFKRGMLPSLRTSLW
ncbi:MAG: chitobiase/beta-hexosaminidase C-terminal domain-containing protein [Armatimonadota bacterium]